MSSNTGHVETMRWTDGLLELIDQRRLPHEAVYVTCRDAQQTAVAIRDMVVRGAPAIGCAAAFGVALEAANGGNMEKAYEVLAASRPTAVNLFWALDRMRNAIAAGRSADAEAIAIFTEDIAINRAMGGFGASLIADGASVMTHCNAGALATAGHGTALGVIRSARDAGKAISVIANETRPYLQGARLTAWEMVQENIPVTLITDNMAGHLMQQGKIDLIVVGADRIAANGDTANKIGTYTLAVLAARHKIPFYVAAPVSTFDLAIPDGTHIPIEQRHADEVTGYGDTRWAPHGVMVSNPAFDVTPADLITALITERGIIRTPDKTRIAQLIGH
ncbi:MAG: S-methyl-5-thioribose-1-phosphate isomerase [Proteobacteria bacterium]|nr:S-methyl-5-thioribose-1-phosphate isomerase [Pseudomonadota bacterium]